MPKPNQTLNVLRGIAIVRDHIIAGTFARAHYDDISALCDYTEAQISAQARGRSAGGTARAAKLSKKKRSVIAKAGAAARWKNKTTEEK